MANTKAVIRKGIHGISPYNAHIKNTRTLIGCTTILEKTIIKIDTKLTGLLLIFSPPYKRKR
jgi:hypothetical protein